MDTQPLQDKKRMTGQISNPGSSRLQANNGKVTHIQHTAMELVEFEECYQYGRDLVTNKCITKIPK